MLILSSVPMRPAARDVGQQSKRQKRRSDTNRFRLMSVVLDLLILVLYARSSNVAFDLVTHIGSLGFLDRVVRRQLKQRVSRLAAIDVSQTISVLTDARVAVLAHHNGLQLRGIPTLGDDADR